MPEVHAKYGNKPPWPGRGQVPRRSLFFGISSALWALLPSFLIGGFAIGIPLYPWQTLAISLFIVVAYTTFREGPFFGAGAWVLAIAVGVSVSSHIPLFAGASYADWLLFSGSSLLVVMAGSFRSFQKNIPLSPLLPYIASESFAEDPYEFLLERTPVLVWSCRSDGVWDFVNRQWETYTGVQLEELNRMGCESIMNPLDVSSVQDEWKQALEHPRSFDVEVRLRSKSGEYQWFITHFQPELTEGGRPYRWMLSSTSIDTAKSVETSMALRETDARTVTKTLPFLILYIDRAHRVTFANEAFRSWCDKTQITGKSAADVFGMDTYAELQAILERVGLGAKEESFVLAWKKKKEPRTVYGKVVPEHAADGAVKGFVVILEEEESPHRIHAEKASLFDEAPVFLWTREPSGEVSHVNRRLREVARVSDEELREKGEETFLHPVDVAVFRDRWERAQRKRVGFEVELRFRNEAGEYRWFATHVLPVRDRQGRILRWVISAVDQHAQVAERWESLKAIQESETLYRTIGEAVPDFLWSATEDLETDLVNRRWTEYTGFTLRDVQEKGWIDLYHPDDRERIRIAWEKAKADPAPVEIEFRYRGKDGHYEWFVTRAVPLMDGMGKVNKWVGTSTNIQSRKQIEHQLDDALRREQAAREEAEQSSRIKGEFLETLARELRTPMNAVVSWSQMLQERREPGEVFSGLEFVERNARQQAQLIDDLLDISRVISGKIRIARERVNVTHIAEDVVRTVRSAAIEKGVRLLSRLNAHAEQISGDSYRVQQAIWNFLVYAIQVSPGGGRVEIESKSETGKISILISDSSRESNPARLASFFEQLDVWDMSVARDGSSSFLGLTLGYHLVKLHGGTVNVTPKEGEHGCRYELAFPVSLNQELFSIPKMTTALSNGVVKTTDDHLELEKESTPNTSSPSTVSEQNKTRLRIEDEIKRSS